MADHGFIEKQQYRSKEYLEYETIEEEIPMKDGVKLKAVIYLPKGVKGPFPVIWKRTPYGKGGPSFFADFAYYGYACVQENCRGTHGSQGIWEPFENEYEDGLCSLAWIEAQPWCDGNIGMTGFSYLSMCQWLLGERPSPALKSLDIEVYNPYRYRQLYQNGMFRLEAYTGWTAYNSGLKDLPDHPHNLYEKALWAAPPIDMDEQVFGRRLDWYRDWIRIPQEEDPYWHSGVWERLDFAPQKLQVPIMMHAGWYDSHLTGMMQAWNEIPAFIRQKSICILGPFNHQGEISGDVDFHNAYEKAGNQHIRGKLIWFDHTIRGMPLPEGWKEGAVYSYVMGADRWKEYACWPPQAKQKQYYLDLCQKALLEEVPSQSSQASYWYDSANPSKSQGSEVIMIDYIYQPKRPTAAGRKLQKDSEEGLVLLSAPFQEDMEIAGNIGVRLYVASDAEDTAFFVRLSEVDEQGQAYSFRSGISTLRIREGNPKPQDYEPNSMVCLEFTLPPVDMVIKKGRRLRMNIASSDFPAFHIHPNEKGVWSVFSRGKKARQTVLAGGETLSALLLPIIKEKKEEGR